MTTKNLTSPTPNDMLLLAALAHTGQVDKAGAPYIRHPIAVMNLLDSSADDELRCMALGHDLLEDTTVTAEDLIEYGFSRRVVDGIIGLTKVPGESRRKKMTRLTTSPDVIRVKLADLQHNMDTSRFPLDYVLTPKDVARLTEYVKMTEELTLALTEK
jgi:(p)ppGpp synthase/HD superfamily hydrolase